jgi:hypothetical protein
MDYRRRYRIGANPDEADFAYRSNQKLFLNSYSARAFGSEEFG